MNHERRTAFRVRLRSAMVKLFPAALIKETDRERQRRRRSLNKYESVVQGDKG